jgi:hypothetical protein
MFMNENPQNEELTKFKNQNVIDEGRILGSTKGGRTLSEMDESRDDWMFPDKKAKGGRTSQGTKDRDDATTLGSVKGGNPNKSPKKPPHTS